MVIGAGVSQDGMLHTTQDCRRETYGYRICACGRYSQESQGLCLCGRPNDGTLAL